MREGTCAAPGDAACTLLILPAFPPQENAPNALNPGGISSSKVSETNAGLIGLKSPLLGGSEPRCQSTG